MRCRPSPSTDISEEQKENLGVKLYVGRVQNLHRAMHYLKTKLSYLMVPTITPALPGYQNHGAQLSIVAVILVGTAR
jgi:hypothetical protein